jgi:hypothetical protein
LFEFFIFSRIENLQIFLMLFYRSCGVIKKFSLECQISSTSIEKRRISFIQLKKWTNSIYISTLVDVLPILLALLQRKMIIYIFSWFSFSFQLKFFVIPIRRFRFMQFYAAGWLDRWPFLYIVQSRCCCIPSIRKTVLEKY